MIANDTTYHYIHFLSKLVNYKFFLVNGRELADYE